jgi:hypothetical protein
MRRCLLFLAVFFSATGMAVRADTPFLVEADPPPLRAGSMLYILAPAPYRVLVDGVSKGATPVLLADLSSGPHVLVVESDALVCHQPLDVDLTIQTLTRYQPVMRPFSGTLTVNSSEPAEVVLEGVPMGTTPLRLERIAADTYRLAVVSERHARVDRTVVIRRDGTESVDVQLVEGYRLAIEPPPPPDATVELLEDGTEGAKEFQFTDLPLLPAGSRTFRVHVEGFEPFQFSVDPSRTAQEPVRFTPRRVAGFIRFTGLPMSGVVTIDGRIVDASADNGLLTVAPGVLSIGAQAPHFLPFSGIAYAEAGQTVVIPLMLQKDRSDVRKKAGWITLASGLAVSGCGMLLNLNDVAIPATSSYQGYLTWKHTTLAASGVGIGALAAAVLLLLLK